MLRDLRVFQPLDGPAERLTQVFAADPSVWLPAASTAAKDTWRLPVHAGSWSRDVITRLGEPWHVTRTTWRRLSWEPVAGGSDTASVTRVLPRLTGELGVHVDITDRATLIIDAHYQPPGGLIGAAADAVALHRIARLTGERLLQDIGRGLMAAARASPPALTQPAPGPGAGPEETTGTPHARPSAGDERHAPEHARTATRD
jgi:hypothetical protein